MTIALVKSNAGSVRALLEKGLRSTVGDAPLRRALVADHIRSAIFSNAAIATEINVAHAVHSTRLLTAARRATDFVWPETSVLGSRDGGATSDVARLTLDALSAFGDMVDTGGGYWVGTPLRFLRSGDCIIALGCAPNAVIKDVTGNAPICASIARIVEIRPSALPALQDITLSASQWIGPSEDIRVWTKRILAQHETHLASGDLISAEQLEMYAPDLLIGGQRNPWVPCQGNIRTIEGLRLCRPLRTRAFVWDRPYYLARLTAHSGELVVSASVKVDYSLTRRLRFGISSLQINPQIISAVVRDDLVEIELPPGLPDPEARIAALGWPLISNSKCSVFHKRVVPLLTEVLARLAIRIVVR